jgi:hypothetical protein
MTKNKITLFISDPGFSPQKNLEDFIELARFKLTVFGKNLEWDSKSWDISDFVKLRGRKGKVSLCWTDLTTSKEEIGPLMTVPYLDFAKSYIRYSAAIRPTKYFSTRLNSIRAIEYALKEITDSNDIAKADASVFTLAAALLKKKFAKTTIYAMGRELEMIADFITDNHFVSVPIDWKNPLARQYDINRVGKDADERRAKKMPSQTSLDALAKVFCLAKSTRDILISSIAAILCSAPDRINEVLRLPVNAEITNEDAYGLRWWPSKGAEPMIKWIAGTMAPVTKEAIRKIKIETEQARKIALWYEQNPTKIYLDESLEYLRNKEYLNGKEITFILGFAARSSYSNWLKSNKVPNQNKGRKIICKFSDIEKAVLNLLPSDFPIFDHENDLKYSEALLVIQKNALHTKRTPIACMIEKITIDSVNSGLGSKSKYGFSSIFTSFGFKEPDGSDICILSNQFRHWLNTLAQRGGLSQVDIAKWSGRKNIHQNEAYDHMTANELLAKVKSLDEDSFFGPLAEFIRNNPVVSREDFIDQAFATAHVTEIGFCIHDWVMLPCQIHRDCINCNQHVCVKGDAQKNNNIRATLRDSKILLEKAIEAKGDGFYGADRWLEHQQEVVSRLSELVKILDDPTIPNGSIIQLNQKEQFSQIALSHQEHQLKIVRK